MNTNFKRPSTLLKGALALTLGIVSQTGFSQTYCTSGATSTADTEIDQVMMTGNTQSIMSNSAGICSTYSDSTAQVADVSLGGNYSVDVLMGTCGSTQYGKLGKVYVDWNADGDFDDAGEEIGQVPYTAYGVTPTNQTINFSVPATAAIGQTRMRVVVRETSVASLVTPCGTFSYGETEDYTIDVTPFALDAAVLGYASPTFPTCNIDSTVSVYLFNAGSNALTSATLNVEVNGVVINTVNWTGSLALGQMDTVTVATNQFVDGDVLTTYVTNPNGSVDQNPVSDTNEIETWTALSGAYTIGSSGDFTTLNQAVTLLEDFGVCGPVELNLDDTVFIEQVELTSYAGMSATNTVTIQSVTPGAAELVFASTGTTDNYVVKFDNAQNFIVKDLQLSNAGTSYARVFSGEDNNSNIVIENNVITGGTATSTSFNMAAVYFNGENVDSVTIMNNEIYNGSYGLYFYGDFNNYGTDNIIDGNMIYDSYYRYMNVYYQNHIKFRNNEMMNIGGSTYNFSSYGLYLFNVYGNADISNNTLISDSAFPTYGFRMGNITGQYTSFAKLYNNRVKVGDATGGYTYDYHQAFYGSNMMFVDVVNNSFVVDSAGDAGSEAMYLSGGLMRMYNNIAANYGLGTSLYSSNATIMDANNNNYSSNGTNLIYANGNYPDLASYVAASGLDSMSISLVDPITDMTTLKICNDSLFEAGMPISWVMVDFEDDVRHATPCIGADEFAPLSAVDLGADVLLCDNDTLEYRVNYFDTVVWNGTDTSKTIMISNPGMYQVYASGICGSVMDTLMVSPQEYASFAPSNICEGSDVTLNPMINGDATYTWNDGTMDSVMTVDVAGTYWVEVVDAGGCVSSDTVVVTQSYNVNLPDSVLEFCEGGSVYLDADMAGTYVWSDGSSNQVLQATASGTYSVEVTDNYGCVSSDTAEVFEVLLPVANASIEVSYFTVVTSDSSENVDTYNWDFGDGNTSDQPNTINIYDSNNVYTVVLTVTNQCGMDTAMFEVGITVSVEEIADVQSMQVFPNPAVDNVNISLDAIKSSNVLINVVDLQGKVVATQNEQLIPGQNNLNVNVSNLAKGVYMLQMQIGEDFIQQKVVKK